MYCAVFTFFTTSYHTLSLIVICCHSLSFVVTLCHSLSLVVPLVVTRCHSLYHSLTFVFTRCHLLSLVLPLVVTRCHSLYHSLTFVFTRCHSLSLVVLLVVTRCHSMYPESHEVGEGVAEGEGSCRPTPLPKNPLKNERFRAKNDSIRAKINHASFTCK